MSFSVSSFGKTSDGKEVKLYTLKNKNGTEAAFTDLGADWVSMKVKDKLGKVRDVVFGYDNAAVYENNPTTCGECVGRNANRIGNAKFTLGGKEYELAKNDHGKNNLHSGPDYWKSRVFSAEAGEGQLGSRVTFSLHSKDMDQGYPGNLDFTVTYTLQDNDSLMIEYSAESDQETICNPTNHAYFNLSGHDSGLISAQEVWINADAFTPADAFSVPTGEIRPVSGTPMDFTIMKEIGKDIDADYDQLKFAGGFDHNYVLNGYDGKLKLAAKAKDRESGIVMKVYTDLPGVQFYSGNHLKSSAPGKDDADYALRTGYCFETQFFPDAVNHPEWPQPVIKPGEKYHHFTVYEFGV
jgi:aldose 1-epimerase